MLDLGIEPIGGVATRTLLKLHRTEPSDSTDWKRYREDPVGFVSDILGVEKIAPYQEKILRRLLEKRRLGIRSPHGAGKTSVAAWVFLWFGCSWTDNTKIVVTASGWRQVEFYFWNELKLWHRRANWARWRLLGGSVPRLTAQTFTVDPGTVGAGAVSDDPAKMEGAHAERMLYIFDEAKTIIPETWEAAEGALSTGECFWLALSTPGLPSGYFYDLHTGRPGLEDWDKIHITLEEAIAAGRINSRWVEQRKILWGEESPVYEARVLGNFPTQVEDALFSHVDIERTRETKLEIEEDDLEILGVDPARYGDDDTTYCHRHGRVILDLFWKHGKSTMDTAGRVRSKGVPANVDEIGVGSGVVDRLKEQKFPVNGVNVARKPLKEKKEGDTAERFNTLRDQLYWNLSLAFKNGDIDLSRLSHRSYTRLMGELVAIRYAYTSAGKIKVDSKDEIKARLKRSPDCADALMLTYCPFRPNSKGWMDYLRDQMVKREAKKVEDEAKPEISWKDKFPMPPGIA